MNTLYGVATTTRSIFHIFFGTEKPKQRVRIEREGSVALWDLDVRQHNWLYVSRIAPSGKARESAVVHAGEKGVSLE